jgi:hypothetical protein
VKQREAYGAKTFKRRQAYGAKTFKRRDATGRRAARGLGPRQGATCMQPYAGERATVVYTARDSDRAAVLLIASYTCCVPQHAVYVLWPFDHCPGAPGRPQAQAVSLINAGMPRRNASLMSLIIGS